MLFSSCSAASVHVWVDGAAMFAQLVSRVGPSDHKPSATWINTQHDTPNPSCPVIYSFLPMRQFHRLLLGRAQCCEEAMSDDARSSAPVEKKKKDRHTRQLDARSCIAALIHPHLIKRNPLSTLFGMLSKLSSIRSSQSSTFVRTPQPAYKSSQNLWLRHEWCSDMECVLAALIMERMANIEILSFLLI